MLRTRRLTGGGKGTIKMIEDLSTRHGLVGDLFALPSTDDEWDQYRLTPDPMGADGWQLSVTGEHWFSPSWALRYDLGGPEASSSLRRQGLRLGVQYRF